ncbi:MAG TPA: 30S ribosome-binding factor RbfA [Kiloniellales bacterium]|jgi:ribosome-binding factor A|nr:30S ribosome-binding factor RbfA [Kiloniellales bacterium]
MARSKGKAPSQRQLRVGELIRHELARLLNDGTAHDPVLRAASITVSEVRTSPDIKNATAFVLPLAGQDREAILSALRRAAPYFRRRLAETVELRYTPRLDFRLDLSFDEAERIERLLDSERVRQDLDEKGASDTDSDPDLAETSKGKQEEDDGPSS